jgi:hypothetical protein
MKSKSKKPPKYTLVMTAKPEYVRDGYGKISRNFLFTGNNLEKMLLAVYRRRDIHKKTCFEYAHIIKNTVYTPRYKEQQTLLFFKL